MSTPELNKALVKFHAAMEGNIKKQSQGYNYKYADLAATLNAIRTPMVEAGLSLYQTVKTHRDVTPALPVLLTTVTHESGEEISSEFPLSFDWESLTKGNTLQNIGSTLTYIRRYSLQAILNLATDDDGASSTYTPPQNVKPKPAPKAQPKTEPKEIFVPGEDPPFNLPEKYDTAKTLLKFVEQAKEEIAEIAFPGRLLAWKKDNNNMLGRLQKAHPDKFAEVGAAYKTAEENLKGK